MVAVLKTRARAWLRAPIPLTNNYAEIEFASFSARCNPIPWLQADNCRRSNHISLHRVPFGLYFSSNFRKLLQSTYWERCHWSSASNRFYLFFTLVHGDSHPLPGQGHPSQGRKTHLRLVFYEFWNGWRWQLQDIQRPARLRRKHCCRNGLRADASEELHRDFQRHAQLWPRRWISKNEGSVERSVLLGMRYWRLLKDSWTLRQLDLQIDLII